MKKEKFIRVPLDKCPLDVLADLGEETRFSRIFLHKNAIEKLVSTADIHDVLPYFHHRLKWNATEKYPETTVITASWYLREGKYKKLDWIQVMSISATDIAFECVPEKTAIVFYLKMETSRDNNLS